MTNMLVPPTANSRAKFSDSFGQRSLLTVDTEEEFDWNKPFSATEHGLEHVSQLQFFQEFCENLNVSPVYLVDWPITQSPMACEILSDAIGRGKAEIGIQLHPWVNPPHDEEVTEQNSYAGNLPAALEREKFTRLRDAIIQNFGAEPMIYRAGRYGLGPQTQQLLADTGTAVDTSVRSNFDYSKFGGPNYSRHPLHPYWTGPDAQVLELPVTTVFWGMLRRQGPMLQSVLDQASLLRGAFSKFGLLERIALTPEGVTAQEALRGIDIALDDELPLLVLSFHSPSLAPGHTPYVKDKAGVDRLYNWFRDIYCYLEQRGVRPTNVREIMQNAVLPTD